jgi:hypothetical protein
MGVLTIQLHQFNKVRLRIAPCFDKINQAGLTRGKVAHGKPSAKKFVTQQDAAEEGPRAVTVCKSEYAADHDTQGKSKCYCAEWY